jgi:hypothetical protein
MRDPDPPVGLIEETSFDVGDHGHYRRRTVRLDQNSEAVGENFPVDACGPDR